MQLIGALLAGLLFGIGLLLSGLANPDKVLQFLDISSNWDPSLVFVMGGAILVAILPFNLASRNRIQPVKAVKLDLPARTSIDKFLIIGSLLFGAGWGLIGYCPGPALVSFAGGIGMAAWFLPAMLVGMGLAKLTRT